MERRKKKERKFSTFKYHIALCGKIRYLLHSEEKKKYQTVEDFIKNYIPTNHEISQTQELENEIFLLYIVLANLKYYKVDQIRELEVSEVRSLEELLDSRPECDKYSRKFNLCEMTDSYDTSEDDYTNNIGDCDSTDAQITPNEFLYDDGDAEPSGASDCASTVYTQLNNDPREFDVMSDNSTQHVRFVEDYLVRLFQEEKKQGLIGFSYEEYSNFFDAMSEKAHQSKILKSKSTEDIQKLKKIGYVNSFDIFKKSLLMTLIDSNPKLLRVYSWSERKVTFIGTNSFKLVIATTNFSYDVNMDVDPYIKKNLKNLRRGWNIVLPDPGIHLSPSMYISTEQRFYEYYGTDHIGSAITNSSYNYNIMRRKTDYIPIKDSKSQFLKENTKIHIRMLNLLNKLSAQKYYTDSTIINYSLNNQKFHDYNLHDLDIIKINEYIESLKLVANEPFINSKQKLNLYKNIRTKKNIVAGYEELSKMYGKILDIYKNLGNNVMYINYFFDSRGRIYPESFASNHQNYYYIKSYLKNIDTLHEIHENYKSFFNKPELAPYVKTIDAFFLWYNKGYSQESLNDLKFFSEKIWNVDYNQALKETKPSFTKALNTENFKNIIKINTFASLIFNLGGYVVKISTNNNDEFVFSKGLILFKELISDDFSYELYHELITKYSVPIKNTLSFLNICLDLTNMYKYGYMPKYYYSVDATTNAIQITSMMQFCTNKNLLQKCGLENGITKDFYTTILDDLKVSFLEFIKKIKSKKAIAKNVILYFEQLLTREFVKAFVLPITYNCGRKGIAPSVNEKLKDNDNWVNLDPKERSLLVTFVYEGVHEFLEKNGISFDLVQKILSLVFLEKFDNSHKSPTGFPVYTMVSNHKTKMRGLNDNFKKYTASLNILKESIEKRIKNVGCPSTYQIARKNKLDNLLSKVVNDIAKLKDDLGHNTHKLVQLYSYKDFIKNDNVIVEQRIKPYKLEFDLKCTKVSVDAMFRAIYVNRVHSCDAALLMMVIEHCNFNVLCTHDSFSSNICYIEILELAYKISFIEMIKIFLTDDGDLIYSYCKDSKDLTVQEFIAKHLANKEIFKNNINLNNIIKLDRLIK